MSNKKKLINEQIRANKVQVITDEGENLWEMSFRDARNLASEKELDLMEIWKKGDVVIVKMLDYWKYLYRQKKQEQKQKQKWKAPDLKTVRITFKMSDHDMQTRINQVIKFAKNGHPLKVTLMLRWRENHYSDLALEKMQIFVEKIEDYYKLDNPIKKNWNTFVAMLKVKK
jgi:translation initiation factor IF-3